MGFLTNAKAKTEVALYKAAQGIEAVKNTKVEGDSQLIVALVLIAVAVGLAIVFRNGLGGILNSGLANTQAKVTSLFNGTVV